MTKTVDFDRQGVEVILRGINKPIKNARPYFNILGIKVDQSTQQTFRNLGARGGRSKWTPYSQRTLHPSWKVKGGQVRIDFTKWNKRRGTDNSKTRRYNASSQLLQASGQFRKSFRILTTTNNRMVYGTNHKDAKGIIGKRPVLFVTSRDKQKWGREFVRFYNRGLKF